MFGLLLCRVVGVFFLVFYVNWCLDWLVCSCLWCLVYILFFIFGFLMNEWLRGLGSFYCGMGCLIYCWLVWVG